MRLRSPTLVLLVTACAMLCTAALCLAGCGGTDPNRMAHYAALDDGLDAIEVDAELGIRARSNAQVAALLGVQPITPEAAEFARETLTYHRAIIDNLRKMETGTLDANAPLPAGPTRDRLPSP